MLTLLAALAGLVPAPGMGSSPFTRLQQQQVGPASTSALSPPSTPSISPALPLSSYPSSSYPSTSTPPTTPPSRSDPSSTSSSSGGVGSGAAAVMAALQAAGAVRGKEATAMSSAASITAAFAAVDQLDVLKEFTFQTATASPATTAASTSSSGGVGASGDESESAGEDLRKRSRGGKPPTLVSGEDDIFWMSQLHASLDARGFWSGDEDIDNWLFGDGTQSALLALQASEGLMETGIVDEATWRALLREAPEEVKKRVSEAIVADLREQGASQSEDSESDSDIYADDFEVPRPQAGLMDAIDRQGEARAEGSQSWPVLMETDGGREVHFLQVALANKGYSCGHDDMEWWQFGERTKLSLSYFQSSAGLPESGVTCERTWRALLGPDAQPTDLYLQTMLGADGEVDTTYDNDMTEGPAGGGVYLLGEGRWEVHK